MARNKVQDALRQRKRSEAEAAMANGPPEEGAYQCFFNRDDLPSPMEGGTLCDFPLAQLSGFPDHEEHFPLYTGARLEDMVESIRRHGVQSPILVWKTAEGTYIIISGHNRVNASKIAGLTTIPAVIRTDLTQETAEDLFYEMNFRQRSLADMLFSQRVLCIAAHYNMLKRQGRRTDLQTFETTSPDTQEKSHTDVKIAQEYELTRDKVSKYCRYATLYRPLLLLMNSGKRLGQLAAYEISFVEDHKHTSQHLRLPDGVFDMLGMVHGVYDEEALKALDTAAAESAGKKKRKWFSRKEASPLSRLEAGATTIPDLIAPPDIDTHHPDYLLIDGVCHAYLYISGYGYSTVVGKGWLTPLIEAGEGVSLSFYLVKQPREKTVNAIGQTTMINRSRMRDVGDTRQDFEELGDAIGAGLYLKEGMNREGQDFYYMHTLIEVIADDPDTLEQRVTAVETLCVASDMLAKRCEYKHEAAFLSFLPLLISDPDIERKSRRNALTSGVAASFPFASFELSDQKGIFLGLNLYNRSPVFIDLYDDYKYTNGNFAAFGNSGAGKSTLLQSIGKRLREQQRKVIYIVPEKGHEYRPLCEAVGGQFIKLGPSSPDCIGLMDIRRLKASPYAAQNGGTQRRESLLAEKVSWLSVWYSLQKRNLSEEDMNYIDASLIECYGRRGITFDNASLFEEDGVTIKEMPVIQEWYDILREKQETKHLSVILTRYVSGSAASMGGHTNVDTENPYIVIDLTDIPDDLQLATVYAATGFATDITVQNGDVGTALLSDELWKLLGANSNPLAADYTMRMVKLIRSQGGVAGVTSQGMADMMALDGGKYGKGILDSCRIKFIMQMEDQEARLVQNILNLTEEETKMITRFRRGEGLLCIGHNHVPIAVHVSPREYEAITTSPTDLRARQQARVE